MKKNNEKMKKIFDKLKIKEIRDEELRNKIKENSDRKMKKIEEKKKDKMFLLNARSSKSSFDVNKFYHRKEKENDKFSKQVMQKTMSKLRVAEEKRKENYDADFTEKNMFRTLIHKNAEEIQKIKEK